MRNSAIIPPRMIPLMRSDFLNTFAISYFNHREHRLMNGYLHDFSQKKRPRELFETGTAASMG